MKIWTLKLTFRNATLLQNKCHQDVNQQILLPRNKNFPQGPLPWHQNSQKYFTGKLHKIVLLRRFIWNLRTSFLRPLTPHFHSFRSSQAFMLTGKGNSEGKSTPDTGSWLQQHCTALLKERTYPWQRRFYSLEMKMSSNVYLTKIQKYPVSYFNNTEITLLWIKCIW